jgi:hypothetical protein
VFSLTSAGKGVALSALKRAFPQEAVGTRTGGYSLATGGPRKFKDIRFRIDGGKKMTVIAEGQPLNLLEPAWWERHATVTGAGGGITMAVLVAATMQKPDIVTSSKDSRWRKWEAEALRQISRLKLDKPIPLPGWTAEEHQAAKEDLRRFSVRPRPAR